MGWVMGSALCSPIGCLSSAFNLKAEDKDQMGRVIQNSRLGEELGQTQVQVLGSRGEVLGSPVAGAQKKTPEAKASGEGDHASTKRQRMLENGL